MSAQEITEFVIARLERVARQNEEPLETAGEIADALGFSQSTVSGILRRLEDAGRAKKVGTSFTGARTWTVAEEEA